MRDPKKHSRPIQVDEEKKLVFQQFVQPVRQDGMPIYTQQQ